MFTSTKAFDAPFFVGAFFVLVSLGLAFVALRGNTVPLVGAGRGALIAVAVVGMAGCAIGGIGVAPAALGWTHPITIIGSVLGVLALLVIAGGIAGWQWVLQPIAGAIPGGADMDSDRLAIAAVAAVIAVKWVIGIGMNVMRAA